jgi:hypothetical protein
LRKEFSANAINDNSGLVIWQCWESYTGSE